MYLFFGIWLLMGFVGGILGSFSESYEPYSFVRKEDIFLCGIHCSIFGPLVLMWGILSLIALFFKR